MKKLFPIFLAVIGFWQGGIVPALADDSGALAGKWTEKKTSDEGRAETRVLEFKKDKFSFSVLNSEDNFVFYAEGDFQLEKLGPFSSIKFKNMKIGESVANTQPYDENRDSIYQLRDGALMLAMEFDAVRDQKPSLQVFKKSAATASEPMTLIIDKIVMHQTPQVATWFICFEAKTDGAMQRYRIPNQSFDRDGVTIPMDLKVPNVRAGQTCTFKCQLDDVEEDVCTDDIDNTTGGKFTVTESGSQEYKPEDRWRYTVYWHLK
ncbi:MAG: hypothetical protein ABIV39_13160 [Verrucomicrobiota bacterium]